MPRRELLGESDADGTHRDVQRAGAESGEQTIRAVQHLGERGIIAEHGEYHGPSPSRFERRGGKGRAAVEQRLRFCRRTIPYGQLVTGAQQIRGDRRAHVAQTHEPYAHHAVLGYGADFDVGPAPRNMPANAAARDCVWPTDHAGAGAEHFSPTIASIRGVSQRCRDPPVPLELALQAV